MSGGDLPGRYELDCTRPSHTANRCLQLEIFGQSSTVALPFGHTSEAFRACDLQIQDYVYPLVMGGLV